MTLLFALLVLYRHENVTHDLRTCLSLRIFVREWVCIDVKLTKWASKPKHWLFQSYDWSCKGSHLSICSIKNVFPHEIFDLC